MMEREAKKKKNVKLQSHGHQTKEEDYTHGERIFAISPLQSKARAILQATKYFQWRCANIEIKTDCVELISSLKNLVACNKDIASIIKEVMEIASSFQQFNCSKATRLEMQDAHILANKARRFE